MVILANTNIFQTNPNQLSIAITLDLILTVPLVYFLLIRKKSISKFTITPFFIGGIIVASLILPKDQQGLLSQIKTYLIPVVELIILFAVGNSFRKTYKQYKLEKNESIDFYTAIKIACANALPGPAARAFATEISMVYYSIINWKTYKLKENEFSYHRKNGTAPLLNILIFVIAIEMFGFHILISNWSIVGAWILTGLSFYSGLQILAISKSLSKRPIRIQDGLLKVRYGIFSEAIIPISEIEDIEMKKFKKLEFDKTNRSFSLLKDIEKYNVKVTMKNESEIEYLYGIKKSFKTLAFGVDDLDGFKKVMNEELIQG
jgi:hypothetical protein